MTGIDVEHDLPEDSSKLEGVVVPMNAPPPKEPPQEPEKGDPFDLAKLRISQDFASQAGVKKVITVVPCRKPGGGEFIRVRSGDDWRLETAVLEDNANREMYLVAESLRSSLENDVRSICLLTTITRQGDVFLWPVKLPSANGRRNLWNDSALEGARLAESNWVRISSNQIAGCYGTWKAAGDLGDPDWPPVTFQELIRIAFKDRLIDDINHPVLRALRGEV